MVYNVTKVYVLNNEVLYVDEGAISRDSSNYNLIEVITNVSGWGVEIAFELPNGVFSNRFGMLQQVGSFVVPSDITELSSVAGEEWSKYQLLIPNAVLSAITATTSQTLGFSLRFSQTLNEGEEDEYTQSYTTEKETLAIQGTIGGEAVSLDPDFYQNSIVTELNNLISLYNAINNAITDETTGLAQKVTKSGDTVTGQLDFSTVDLTQLQTPLASIKLGVNNVTTSGKINDYTFGSGTASDAVLDAIKYDNLGDLFDVDISSYTGSILQKYTQALAAKFAGIKTEEQLAVTFLKRDGTDAMTGALDMGDNNIINVGNVDGVDVSQLNTTVNNLLQYFESNDADNVINTIQEIIEIFNGLGEEFDLLTSLNNKIDVNGENSNLTELNYDNGNATLTYDTDRKILNFTTNDGTSLQVGGELWFVNAKTNDALSSGDLVQFAGSQGDHYLVKKAVGSEIQANKDLFVGVATHDAAINDYVKITWFGEVSDLSTDGWSLGDILYFDTSNGGLINVEPTTNPIIQVAAVTKLEDGTSSNGRILVRPQFISRFAKEVFIEDENNKFTATTVEGGLEEVYDKIQDHEDATTSIHPAGGITYDDTNTALGSTNVQGVVEALDTKLEGHTDENTNAHAASAISYDDTSIPLTGANVQSVLADLFDGQKIKSSLINLQFEDVEQYNDFGSFPATGEDGKLYIDVSTNDLYRWNGTTYITVIQTPDSLEDITNVIITSPTNGQFLKYDGTNWINASIPTINSINDIADVDTTGVVNGSVLKYNTSTSKWEVGVDDEGTTINALNDIGDVSVAGVTANQFIKRNAGNTAWENHTLVKDDVGLDNVENYPTALDTDVDNNVTNKYMTPSSTAYAVNTKYSAGVIETNNSTNTKLWTGTQAEYDALSTYDNDTLYFITG